VARNRLAGPGSIVGVDSPAALLAAYDAQLRTDAEFPGAISVARLALLRLVTFPGARGFITYPPPDPGAGLAELVPAALEHFRAEPGIRKVEWKARDHDVVPGLPEALVAAGFVPDAPESIMIGRTSSLAVDVPLPPGVSLRTVTTEDDVRAMSAMADVAFGERVSTDMADALVARLAKGDGMELWVAEVSGEIVSGEIVSAGRLEPVAGTEFAGLWGGATLPAWRGRGIYRALTAARARSALAMGRTLIHSDSTEFSRPILERSGLIKVSTTTPYNWAR